MRFFVAISALLAFGSVVSAAEHKVTDPKGNTIGVILDCNSCQNPEKGENCRSGVQDGFHGGKPCGQCLMLSNYGTKVLYAYDVYVTGKMQQPDGQPLVNEFVRLYLPNTWTVRTRTTEEGFFRLVLGATAPREGEPMSVEIGPRTRAKGQSAADYALFLLPEDYKPCVK